ncbi:hypothetical protein BSL78_28249 [Apostichopus japonicus]|uniref:Ig-like domain-containing protein n=1 Tax=Stichopus japonicus TaxID=307972 RepID=A0A2G8JGQ4_STIJA|nr:hypothetical protein BSL78_28249 [Apostichopus japonicus]
MEYTNPFPIILLAVFLQSHLFVCNSKENIQILVANDIPVLFEDIPLLLVCHIPKNSTHATFSWFKDNVEIAECSPDAGATREIQLPPNVTLKHFEDGTGAFCLLEFKNLSIVDHKGLYTCFSEVGNSSTQEEFNLDILERKPFCTAKKQGPQEYLAGDRATFMCHNPYYSPRREIQLSIGEFRLGGLLNTTRQFTSDLSGTTTIDGRHNGSMFNCAAEQVQEDVAANQTTNTTEYSCSLGPIYIYESSFLLIEEVSEDDCPETMTIRCRVVPAQEEAEINWRIPEDVDDYTIEESGLYSMFKFPANSIDDEEEVVCYTSLANQNLSKSYQLRRFGGCTNPDDEDDGTSMLPFIISVAVVGGIAGTVVFIFILIVIYKCCCGKVGRQRHKPPPSTSNAAKGDIVSDNESNMYPRYQRSPALFTLDLQKRVTIHRQENVMIYRQLETLTIHRQKSFTIHRQVEKMTIHRQEKITKTRQVETLTINRQMRITIHRQLERINIHRQEKRITIQWIEKMRRMTMTFHQLGWRTLQRDSVLSS